MTYFGFSCKNISGPFCVRQKKKKKTFVFIVKQKKNRQIILHLCNVNKSEAFQKMFHKQVIYNLL